ncbi:MAG: DUF4474 domain-containing protein [Clostridia bacterium]|nr:DUF4474 domain-containing protein [Clostridia bacterium]
MNLAALAKHKNTIIAVVALIVVCGGTFLGVRALNRGVDTPQVSSTTTTIPTTLPTTQPTTIPTTIPTTAPTTAPSDVITTFPIPSTTQPTTVPTTQPTTAPTTQPTLPSLPSTQGNAGSSGSTGGSLGGLLDGLGGSSGDKNLAIFDEGLASYQYAPDGNYYYTNEDPWQRALGYNELYDAGAQFVAIYIDTMRCKFEYKGMDWMIQFWKGQYGYVFVGHEIGIYNKPKDRGAEHYDAVSDEEAIYMEMTGYRDGVELYKRDYGKYWWCTGFVPGKLDKFSDRSELSLKARMTMKDYEMLLAFTGALKENGMILGEDFSTKGLDVYVEW